MFQKIELFIKAHLGGYEQQAEAIKADIVADFENLEARLTAIETKLGGLEKPVPVTTVPEVSAPAAPEVSAPAAPEVSTPVV